MKQKVLLPYQEHPHSLMYHYLAFSLGIVYGNAAGNMNPWLSNKYVNCSFSDKQANKFTYAVEDVWFTTDQILLKQTIELYPEQYQLIFQADLLTLFRRMLNLGYYICGLYNEEYIPGKWNYQKQYHQHDFILIGYDNVKQCFLSAGYLKDRVFHRFEIPYDAMKQATATLKNPKIRYIFWKYNSDVQYRFDLQRLIADLSDYLTSTSSLKVVSRDKVWGLAAIAKLAESFSDACNQGNPMDDRYTRGLLDHKYFMMNRIEYLLQNGYLFDRAYLEQAKQVYELCEIIHMLALKYNFTGSEMTGKRACMKIRESIEMEQSYLPLVLHDLKDYSKGLVR